MQTTEATYWNAKSEYIEIRGEKYDPARYCGKGLPRFPLLPIHYLVHNHVHPTHALGRNGLEPGCRKAAAELSLSKCKCDLGGLKNNKINKHYRVIVAPDRLN